MAAKPKAEAPPPDEDEDENEAGAEEGAEAEPKKTKKAGLVGRILAPVMGIARFANPLVILKLPLKQKLIAAGALLVVLGGGGAGGFFFLGATPKGSPAGAVGVCTTSTQLPPPQTSLFDFPPTNRHNHNTHATPAPSYVSA